MGYGGVLIRLNEMIIGIHYVVVKGGTTLRKGDHIYRDTDNCIVTAYGWQEPEGWVKLKNEIVLDRDYYASQIEAAWRLIRTYERILGIREKSK